MEAEQGNSEKSPGVVRQVARADKLILWLLIVVSVTLCVVLVFLLSTQQTATVSTEAVPAVPAAQSELDPLTECAHLMPIPFGEKARNECLAYCIGPEIDKAACAGMCEELTAANYARRIRPDDEKPAAVAQHVAAECRRQRESNTAEEAIDLWQIAARDAFNYVAQNNPDLRTYERADLAGRFSRAEQWDRRLRLPAGDYPVEKKFSALLQTVLCVRESLAATQLAVLGSADAADLFSERFYRKVENEMLVRLGALETELRAVYGETLLKAEIP